MTATGAVVKCHRRVPCSDSLRGCERLQVAADRTIVESYCAVSCNMSNWNRCVRYEYQGLRCCVIVHTGLHTITCSIHRCVQC